MIRKYFLLFFLAVSGSASLAQTAEISGKVLDENNLPLPYSTVLIKETKQAASTDAQGNFKIEVPAEGDITVIVSYVGKTEYRISLYLKAGEKYSLNTKLIPTEIKPDTVIIKNTQDPYTQTDLGTTRIDPKLPKFLPSAFGDFNKILVTLPGVVSNNELSSQYQVRGGNFDENLVYVNDMEIYRPFLVRAGQQEGLSFINPDMVSQIEFSAGGWKPRYGDKLSSVLAVKYKDPKKLKASASVSLLTATMHLENASKNRRISYIIGARQKSASYLLRTLPVKGQYKPRFYDIQSYVTLDLSHRKDSLDFEKRTTLGILTSYSRNRYFVQPATQKTSFGTQDRILQLSVRYQGQEVLEYETYQTGLKFFHKFSSKVRTDFILSGMHTVERENSDVLGTYSLAEINTDPNSPNFNQAATIIGSGGLFTHARNKLQATIINFLHRGYYDYNSRHSFEWGMGTGNEVIGDKLSEYSFIDSADYVTIISRFATKVNLNSFRSQAYVQHSYEPDSSHVFTYGLRLSHWTLNQQIFVSPRIQYAWKPRWKRDFIFKAGGGVYQQSPFYRELRDMEGEVHTNVKAQTSIHAVAGSEYNFKGWGGRPFRFTSDLYYKHLTHVIPYDMENVRIRYYGANIAKAYAAGADFRVSGEFIRGLESWFSLGVLSTKEDVEGDGRGYIRRPTDQRVTASIFFQDYFPKYPTIKVYLNLVYGSGLPFGPPGSAGFRSAFSGPQYRRVDIGFSKLLKLVDRNVTKGQLIESVWISAEVLNLLGANNTISYMWITDVNNSQYAVPNTLSARYVNLRMIVKF
jgi:hypothetical protein